MKITASCLALILLLTAGAWAGTEKVLYTFCSQQNCADGAYPYAGVISDKAHNLYGTTQVGGSFGLGTVFEVGISGSETVLYNFNEGSDGELPLAGLARDMAGNLYGTTSQGGSNQSGVVFKLDTSGNETVLYNFAGGTTDGCYPTGGLVRDKAGNLYGTTDGCGTSGYGTVFKVTKTGIETVLHNFTGWPSDGAYPYSAGLLRDAAGNLYGVTQGGGTGCGGYGCGTAFKLDTAGKETLLHRFSGGTKDGCFPVGTLANDAEGNLYGTTGACGSSSVGTVWKLSNTGTETVLHSFTGENGVYPQAGVIIDGKGNLYGDTSNGGPFSVGVVYKLSKAGKETVLHSFTGADGGYPVGSLIIDAKGNVYGTASEDGRGGGGTVWKLTP